MRGHLERGLLTLLGGPNNEPQQRSSIIQQIPMLPLRTSLRREEGWDRGQNGAILQWSLRGAMVGRRRRPDIHLLDG